ncbi:DEAD DEAH box helicase [Coemansia sp. RSA 2320]|nr:DEAD DEAH box helicase [Coemansia sp. RSA 2320]
MVALMAAGRAPRALREHRRWAHTLRPYQQECIDKCLASLQAGVRRQAVSLPVGSGKTVIFSRLIQQIPATRAGATKTLVLAHREELLVQAARQIQAAAPQLTVTIDQGTRQANVAADVVVGSVATLGRAGGARLQRHEAQRFKCIIIDEAHHAAAESYGRVLAHFAAAEPVVWGCSATLQRHDGLGLAGVFDAVVYHKDFLDMVREGWLARMRVATVRTACNIDAVRSYAGDFAPAALSHAVNNSARNEAVVTAHATLGAGRRSTLVFAVDVAHAAELARAFAHFGVRAEAVLGTTPPAERERMLRDFRSGALPVLVNCGILTEGTDIPAIDCVLLARPTRSAVLFQQMLGRGMRLAPAKPDCLVVDFVDSLRRGVAQVTLPTLLGLDPALVLANTDVLDRRELLRQADAHRRLQELESGAAPADDPRLAADAKLVRDFDSADSKGLLLPATLGSLKALGFVSIEHLNPLGFFTTADNGLLEGRARSPDAAGKRVESVSSGSWRLPTISPLAWVCIAPDRYLLCHSNLLFFVTRDPHSSQWRGSKRVLKRFQAAGKSSCMAYTSEAALGMTAASLEHAIRAMDTLVSSMVKHYELKLLRRNAPWRAKPATPRQLARLAQLGVDIPQAVLDEAPIADRPLNTTIVKFSGTRKASKCIDSAGDPWFTRGAAMNLILRLVHGGAKHWNQAEQAKARLNKARAQSKTEAASKALWTTTASIEDSPRDPGSHAPDLWQG